MKSRCERREHLFIYMLLKEDSQRSENSVHYSMLRGSVLKAAVDKIRVFCSVFVYFEGLAGPF